MRCIECGELCGCLHHPSCGKRVVDANYVVPDDCDKIEGQKGRKGYDES